MQRKALVRGSWEMPHDTRLGAFNGSCRYDKPPQFPPCIGVPSTFIMLQLMISSQRSARPFELFVP